MRMYQCSAHLFQFSPPRGGRPSRRSRRCCPGNFNSRPRVGGVLKTKQYANGVHMISILAPAWGASSVNSTSVVKLIFQFSPPRGGRRQLGYNNSCRSTFQFSPPRGGRPKVATLTLNSSLFQFSPPRGGRRRRSVLGLCYDVISILAPAWGASEEEI